MPRIRTSFMLSLALAAGVTSVACTKSEEGGSAASKPSATMTGSAAASPRGTASTTAVPGTTASAAASPAATASGAASADTGHILTGAELLALKLPTPAKVPPGGGWNPVMSTLVDGDMSTNYKVGPKYLVQVRFLDCRRPNIAEYKGKPVTEIGEIRYCFEETKEKLDGFPLFKTDDMHRAVKANNMAILAGTNPDAGGINGADLEALLHALDLPSFAKY